MDQRNNLYGLPAGRAGLPNGMPQQRPQQQQQPGMQPHYAMGDMMFDPLPMNGGMYHQPPPVGNHLMHQQHAGQRTGGLQSLGLLHQQGMVGPEDDLDDLMSALGGDPVGLGGQQQQHLGQMHNHVYDQSHLIPPRSQAQEPHLQAGRTQGMPLTGQAPSMQQQGGIPGAMHLNQMASNGVGGLMGLGIQQQQQQQPLMNAP
ncbi:hypothetical protein BBJ28_00016222, partial [Nothophytophthora sp. Chile5]